MHYSVSYYQGALWERVSNLKGRHVLCCIYTIHTTLVAHQRLCFVIWTRKVSGLYKRPCALEVWYVHGLFTCASGIHKVDLSDEMPKQYTPHSLRIGACVLLYQQEKSVVFIRDRLRWKSDTFMDYLRDTPIVAMLHAAALAQAWSPII